MGGGRRACFFGGGAAESVKEEGEGEGKEAEAETDRGKGKDARQPESKAGDERNEASLVVVLVPVLVPVLAVVLAVVVDPDKAGVDVDPELLPGSPSWTPAVATPSLVGVMELSVLVVVEVAVAGLLLSVPVGILPVAVILSAAILLVLVSTAAMTPVVFVSFVSWTLSTASMASPLIFSTEQQLASDPVDWPPWCSSVCIACPIFFVSIFLATNDSR